MNEIKKMRLGGQQTGHAFNAREVAEFDMVMSLGLCDQFLVKNLMEDNTAPLCVLCQRAVDRGQR